MRGPFYLAAEISAVYSRTKSFTAMRVLLYTDTDRACVVQSAILRAIPNTAVSDRAGGTSPGFNNDLQQESELGFDADRL